MDTTTLIWVIVAIVVILVIVGILLAIGTNRRRRMAEERKDQERVQAAKLRDEGKGAALDARERKVAADRQAADAEQAAVEAERLKLEAERQRSQAASDATASQEKLNEADTLDPDVNVTPSGRQARQAHGRPVQEPAAGEQSPEQPPEAAVPQDQADGDSAPSHAPAHRRTAADS